ncbi:luminal-binding protein 3-like [Hordeum vulgare]|nr:luminal-binding protein 3-like [Hordeum vulgare]
MARVSMWTFVVLVARALLLAMPAGSAVAPTKGDARGGNTDPVAFADSGERLIGEVAKNQAAANPERTIYDAKRLIGREFADDVVQRDVKLLPYPVADRKGKPHIQVQVEDGDVRVFSPEEISGMVLSKLKETAEAYLGEKVTRAVRDDGAGEEGRGRRQADKVVLVGGRTRIPKVQQLLKDYFNGKRLSPMVPSCRPVPG